MKKVEFEPVESACVVGGLYRMPDGVTALINGQGGRVLQDSDGVIYAPVDLLARMPGIAYHRGPVVIIYGVAYLPVDAIRTLMGLEDAAPGMEVIRRHWDRFVENVVSITGVAPPMASISLHGGNLASDVDVKEALAKAELDMRRKHAASGN